MAVMAVSHRHSTVVAVVVVVVAALLPVNR